MFNYIAPSEGDYQWKIQLDCGTLWSCNKARWKDVDTHPDFLKGDYPGEEISHYAILYQYSKIRKNVYRWVEIDKYYFRGSPQAENDSRLAMAG